MFLKTLKPLLVFGLIFVFWQAQANTFLLHSLEGINPPRWEKLGQRKVNYKIERDEIMVTARDGRFTAVKLKVRKGAVNMHKMIIHFGDGSKQQVNLKNKIPAGGETRVINLKGKQKRVIRKVVFWYDTRNLANNRATVELWGRH
jgi:hypothetical protein